MFDTKSPGVSFKRSEQTCVWMRTDPLEGQWITETIIRAKGGIYCHEMTYYERPASTRIYFDTYKDGHFSSRPYSLAQPGDPSCRCCVLALLWNFWESRSGEICAALKLTECEAAGMFLESSSEIREQALWEGMIVPSPWTPQDIDRLVEALYDVNLEDLAKQLELVLESMR